MPNIQLIRHQLIRMLTMCLSEVLMQHDSVADSQAAIHTIHQQENKIRHIASLHYQLPDHEQQDKGNANRTHIACKAFRLTLRTEVEQATSAKMTVMMSEVGTKAT